MGSKDVFRDTSNSGQFHLISTPPYGRDKLFHDSSEKKISSPPSEKPMDEFSFTSNPSEMPVDEFTVSNNPSEIPVDELSLKYTPRKSLGMSYLFNVPLRNNCE